MNEQQGILIVAIIFIAATTYIAAWRIDDIRDDLRTIRKHLERGKETK